MDYQGGSGGGGGFGGGGGGTPMGVSPPSSAGGGGGGGGRARKSYDEQTLQPVTIGMIHASQSDASDDGLQLPDGRKLYHVKIVGAVRSCDNFSTSCVYNIEDGTGLIEVKQWLDNLTDPQAVQDLRAACSKEHIYLACTGQIKDYDGKKTIVADAIRPIANGNELTYHMLEVVYTAEQSKRQNSYVAAPPPMQGVGFAGSTVPMQQQTGAAVGGGGVKDAVLLFVKSDGEESEVGANVQTCIGRLQGQYAEADVRRAIDELAAEGHIYSTIDENNYKFAM